MGKDDAVEEEPVKAKYSNDEVQKALRIVSTYCDEQRLSQDTPLYAIKRKLEMSTPSKQRTLDEFLRKRPKTTGTVLSSSSLMN